MLYFARVFFLHMACMFMAALAYSANDTQPDVSQDIKLFHEQIEKSVLACCNSILERHCVFYDNHSLNKNIMGMKEYKFVEDNLLHAIVFYNKSNENLKEGAEGGIEEGAKEGVAKLKIISDIIKDIEKNATLSCCVSDLYDKHRVAIFSKKAAAAKKNRAENNNNS